MIVKVKGWKWLVSHTGDDLNTWWCSWMMQSCGPDKERGTPLAVSISSQDIFSEKGNV